MKTTFLFFALALAAFVQAAEPKKPDLFELSLKGFVIEPKQEHAVDSGLDKLIRDGALVEKPKDTPKSPRCTVCDADP